MILVTGAGGTVGAELVKRLASEKVPFRAAYHTPEKADRARGRGLDAVVVDFARPETLGPALAGAGTLFLLSGSHPEQTQLEIGAVRAAREAGLKRIVKLSVWNADSEAFTFARIHRAVEKAIEASGLAWTFLRPNGFMQNITNFHAASIRTEGAFRLAGGQAPISHIDVRDIAECAAKVLAGSGHDGRTCTLSGPEALTYSRIAETLSKTLGRPIRYIDLRPTELRQGMIEGGAPAWYADALVDLMRYYLSGQAGRVTSAVRELTGRDPIPFERFAADHVAAFAPSR